MAQGLSKNALTDGMKVILAILISLVSIGAFRKPIKWLHSPDADACAVRRQTDIPLPAADWSALTDHNGLTQPAYWGAVTGPVARSAPLVLGA